MPSAYNFEGDIDVVVLFDPVGEVVGRGANQAGRRKFFILGRKVTPKGLWRRSLAPVIDSIRGFAECAALLQNEIDPYVPGKQGKSENSRILLFSTSQHFNMNTLVSQFLTGKWSSWVAAATLSFAAISQRHLVPFLSSMALGTSCKSNHSCRSHRSRKPSGRDCRWRTTAAFAPSTPRRPRRAHCLLEYALSSCGRHLRPPSWPETQAPLGPKGSCSIKCAGASPLLSSLTHLYASWDQSYSQVIFNALCIALLHSFSY